MAMSNAFAPVALFAYKRPDHLRRAVAALQRDPLARRSDLHVFCDGAKSAADGEAVAAVRTIVGAIDGFASVSVVAHERNQGLARSITAGVTALADRCGRVIVVEDDLAVAPSFLAFMNEALAHYQHDERVLQVTGYMFPIDRRFAADAAFLPLVSTWGWATWRRAWRHFDEHAEGYAELQSSPSLRRRFDLDDAYDYFGMLERQLSGVLDSWGIRWYLSVFMRGGLALWPGTTLVENFGFDAAATHTRTAVADPGRRELPSDPDWRSRWPAEVAVDPRVFAEVKRVIRRMRPPTTFLARVRRLWA